MVHANETSLTERIAAALEESPWEMTGILARKFGVAEAEIVRQYPGDASREMSAARIADLIRALHRLGRVHVICRNDECVLECYGEFGGFSTTGPFLNVQTGTLDMHIMHSRIASAFSLIKPSHQDGQVTYSFQFFNAEGKAVFKVFLYKSIAQLNDGALDKVLAEWTAIRDEFAAG